MKKIVLSLLLILLPWWLASRQDPQFSQYYQAPLYMNPGFTGITEQTTPCGQQPDSMAKSPQALLPMPPAMIFWVDEIKSGFGLIATTDKMGSAGWRTTTASLLYSYKVKLTSKTRFFHPGFLLAMDSTAWIVPSSEWGTDLSTMAFPWILI